MERRDGKERKRGEKEKLAFKNQRELHVISFLFGPGACEFSVR